jgi:hypothetical protein
MLPFRSIAELSFVTVVARSRRMYICDIEESVLGRVSRELLGLNPFEVSNIGHL